MTPTWGELWYRFTIVWRVKRKRLRVWWKLLWHRRDKWENYGNRFRKIGPGSIVPAKKIGGMVVGTFTTQPNPFERALYQDQLQAAASRNPLDQLFAQQQQQGLGRQPRMEDLLNMSEQQRRAQSMGQLGSLGSIGGVIGGALGGLLGSPFPPKDKH